MKETHTTLSVTVRTKQGETWHLHYNDRDKAFDVADSLLASMRDNRQDEDVAAFYDLDLVLGDEGADERRVPTFITRVGQIASVCVRPMIEDATESSDVTDLGLGNEEEDEEETED